MMCSDGLRRVELYDKYFEYVNPNMKLVYPPEGIQKLVTLGICNAKNAKRYDDSSEENPKTLFSRVCDYFIEYGVDCIVGGCTDISSVFSPNEWSNVKYINSLNVLAGVICDKSPKPWTVSTGVSSVSVLREG